MRSPRLALFLLVSLAPAPLRGEEKPKAFPVSWEGTWRGRCMLIRDGRREADFTMELHVAPLEDRDGWTWRIAYGEGEEQRVRPYELVQAEGHRFLIDEKNGVLLDAYHEEDVLRCRFRVVDNVIEATYAREGDALHVTVTTFGAEARRVSGDGVLTPRVESYGLRAVQRGALRRVR